MKKPVFVFLLFCLLLPNIYAEESNDPDLLIFSTTHPEIRYTRKKKDVIKVEIVSFSSIQSVDFNGELVEVTDDHHLKFEMPYDLSTFPEEKATFTITARTEAGIAQKSYVVNFGSKPGKAPFQMVGIFSLTSNDNIYSSPEDQDKDNDIKAVIAVAPRYSFSVGKNSTLVLKGILLREKYSNDDYKDKEISYTQLAVGWVEKKTSWGTLSADIGYNDIRMENANILVGEEETSMEAFVRGKVEQSVTKRSRWNAALQLKVKDADATPSNINYESDANEYTLTGGLKEPLLLLNPESRAFKTSVDGSIAMNDAKGKYMDSNTIWLRAKLGYPIDQWTPEVTLKSQLKTMAIEDPLKENKVPSYLTTTLSMKLKYRLFKKTILAFEMKHKNVDSNIEASTYKQNLMTLSVAQVF